MFFQHSSLILICCYVVGFFETNASSDHEIVPNEACSYPDCGCSGILYHDLMSPWHTYERWHLPWLVRIMQNGEFKAAGALISPLWVISSPLFLVGTKNIESVIDVDIARKLHRAVVKILIPPAATYKVCRFAMMKMNKSIDLASYNGSVSTVCLPPSKSHFYERVQLASYIIPAGYEIFSGSFYRMRHLTLDCCFHDLEKCELDGVTCSSDMCPDYDTLGCRGQIGAPIVARMGKKFYLIAVMCDMLGCEKQTPCAMFPMISHHYDFITREMKN